MSKYHRYIIIRCKDGNITLATFEYIITEEFIALYAEPSLIRRVNAKDIDKMTEELRGKFRDLEESVERTFKSITSKEFEKNGRIGIKMKIA